MQASDQQNAMHVASPKGPQEGPTEMQASDQQNAMHVALRCFFRSPWYFRGIFEAAKLLKNTLICKAWSAGHVGQDGTRTVAMHIED